MTDQLQRQLEAARAALAPDWNEARANRVEAGLGVRARARRRAQVLGALVLLLGVVGVSLWAAPRGEVAHVEAVAGALVQEVPAAQGGGFEVVRGAARVSGKGHPVRLIAGDVEVFVERGRVLVERAGSVSVLVEEGSARVRWPGGQQTVKAGDAPWQRPAPASPQVAALQVVPPPPAPTAVEAEVRGVPSVRTKPAPAPVETPTVVDAPPVPAAAPAPDWQTLARAGDYAASWDSLRTAAPPEGVEALLLAADVARLSGHAEAAVAPLREVLDAHATDARASLAAFTLGRVLLDDLGRPADAAAAFERVQVLAPASRLAEDALARQVEAAFRAGDVRAKELAERFVREYPTSPRLRSVSHFGGLSE